MYVLDSNIDEELHRKLHELKPDGIRCIAFTGRGGWVIITNRDRRFAKNIPIECFNKMREYHNRGHKIMWVAFSPNTTNSWTIITDKTIFSRNIGECHTQMVAAGRQNIRKVIYDPNNSNNWIFIHKGGIKVNSTTLEFRLSLNKIKYSYDIHHIAFDSFRISWVILDSNGHESVRTDEALQIRLDKFKDDGRKIDLVVFDPGKRGWILTLSETNEVSKFGYFKLFSIGNRITRIREVQRLNIPVLLVMPPNTTQEQKSHAGFACQTMLPELEKYFNEISQNQFGFNFRLRTAILPNNFEWKGNANANPRYSRIHGAIQNLDQFPLEKDYTGYFPFEVYDRENERGGNVNTLRNYRLKAYSNIIKAGMHAASARQAWDSRISYDAWVKFGPRPSSSKAYINCIGLNTTGLNSAFVRPFGYNAATGQGKEHHRTKDAVKLLDRIFSDFAWTWWRPNNLRDQWTVAHELGHILGPLDHYSIDSDNGTKIGSRDGYLGTSSIMGYQGRWHLDGVNKWRLGWLEPQIIRRSGGDIRIDLFPVYKSKSEAIVILPDEIDHSQEAFFLEIRNPSLMIGSYEHRAPVSIGNLADRISIPLRGTLRLPAFILTNNKYDSGLNDQYHGVMAYHLAGGTSTAKRPRMDIIGEHPKVRPGIDDPRRMKKAVVGSIPVESMKFYDGTDSGLRIDVASNQNRDGSRSVYIKWV